MAQPMTLEAGAEGANAPEGASALWGRPSLRLSVLFGVLVCVGVVMVTSAAGTAGRGGDVFTRVLVRRLTWTALGLVAFAAGLTVDYQSWRRHHMAIGALAFLVLALVLVAGTEINGARRWLRFGSSIGVQPSEFAKVALIIWMAAYCERCVWKRHPHKGGPMMRTVTWGLLVPGAVAGAASLLVLLEPDFGAAALIGALCVGVMLVCGARLLYVPLGITAALPLVVQKLIIDEPYRLQRVLTFLNPWHDPDGTGYQLIQSMIAIGSGGLTGKGLGMGVQKLGFVQASANDFIFSILAEELGFVGGMVVLAIYGWILWEGLKVALRARDTFGFALAFGLTSLIGLQAALNIAVVTGSVPTKGLSLPLVSAGGSSLFMTLWAAGILVNIARSEETPRRVELTPWYTDIPAYEHTLRATSRKALARAHALLTSELGRKR